MNIILLSGGSGKRLWPLSNDTRSKQFLKLFKNGNGIYESMIQRIYGTVMAVDPESSVTIATVESQVGMIKNQLNDLVNISMEPDRRDTFPAIALAVSYLVDIQKIDRDEPVIVCPVDPLVDDEYFETLKKLEKHVLTNKSKLILMGKKPETPSEKFGYIVPVDEAEISTVREFKEKPDTETAKKLIENGALWNCGVFAFRASYVLERAKEIIGYSEYDRLFDNYGSLNKISFDYAVVEHEEAIDVVKFAGKWRDLGTWDTLSDALEEEVIGNCKTYLCENVQIVNETKIPVVACGISDTVVVVSADGVLVTSKEKASEIKNAVADMSNRPLYEERQWGSYRVLDFSETGCGEKSLTKELILISGKHISYQLHNHREEVWTIVRGEGRLILDGEVKPVKYGDTIRIGRTRKHAIIADTELHIIEVQLGDELREDDIERMEWSWDDI